MPWRNESSRARFDRVHLELEDPFGVSPQPADFLLDEAQTLHQLDVAQRLGDRA